MAAATATKRAIDSPVLRHHADTLFGTAYIKVTSPFILPIELPLGMQISRRVGNTWWSPPSSFPYLPATISSPMRLHWFLELTAAEGTSIHPLRINSTNPHGLCHSLDGHRARGSAQGYLAEIHPLNDLAKCRFHDPLQLLGHRRRVP